MSHVLANGLQLMGSGSSPITNPDFKTSLAKMEDLSQKPQVNEWEKKHVKAVTYYAQG